MLSTPVLDVAIGLSFIYLLLGLICTTLNEMIAGWLKTRAAFLDKGIRRLLGGDAALKSELYKHPLIRSLVEGDQHICPSYIPAKKFAIALMDILSGPSNPHTDVAAVRAGLQTKGDESFRIALTAIMDVSGQEPAVLRKNIEEWFDENMDRVSGWYKRNAQRNALLLAIGITLVMNADTTFIARTLWTNPTMRAAVLEQAKVRAAQDRPQELPMVSYDKPDDPTASTAVKVPTSATEALSSDETRLLGNLTGWENDRHNLTDRITKERNSTATAGVKDWVTEIPALLRNHLVGWILTAFAVSLGAPFWFDTLNRFMNIRNSGRAPDEKRDKSSATATA